MDSTKNIFFFSRGLGRGHAIPDAAIANDLIAGDPNLKITFFSYGLGCRTLTDLGFDVMDLELPDINPVWETFIKITQIMQTFRPDLVISHEEATVVPIARAFNLPCVFMTDWFLPPELVTMQAIKFADEVLFLDEPGYMDELPFLQGKIFYTGAVFRTLDTNSLDRDKSRRKHNFQKEEQIVLVAPSGATIHKDTTVSFIDLTIAAFDNLDFPAKRLVWVASDQNRNALMEKIQNRDNISIMDPHYDLPETIIASDLVITNGNRITIMECEALGVPSISISYGRNPIDDFRIARVRTNLPLRAKAVTPQLLGKIMMQTLSEPCLPRAKSIDAISRGRAAAVERLQFHLKRNTELR